MNNEIEISQFQALNFCVQYVNICADVQYIDKAILLPKLNPIPNSPDYLAGLLNLSGHIIPVIDLAIDMQLHRNEKYSINTIILIAKNQKTQIGIIVDKIIGIESLNKDNFKLTTNEFCKRTTFLKKIVVIEDKLTFFLDLNDFIDNINLISN